VDLMITTLQRRKISSATRLIFFVNWNPPCEFVVRIREGVKRGEKGAKGGIIFLRVLAFV